MMLAMIWFVLLLPLAAGALPNVDVFKVGTLWATSMDIGQSQNLTMNVDTATNVLYIDTPFLYQPSTNGTVVNETHPNSYYYNHTNWKFYGQTRANGCGGIAFRYDVYSDTVNWAGLSLRYQRFGAADYTYWPTHNRSDIVNKLPRPYNGVLGLAGLTLEAGTGGWPVLANLLEQGQIHEPRYGIAFGTADTGKIVLGGVDKQYFDGDLSYADGDSTWAMNVSATVKGSKLFDIEWAQFDTGGPAILGPPDKIRTIFEAAGVQAVDTDTICGRAVFGYYPCDSPPQIGFKIGGKNFDIEATALKNNDDGANNCTANMIGHYGGIYGDSWTVGQAFFQGKYADHDWESNRYGWATLKNPNTPGTSN